MNGALTIRPAGLWSVLRNEEQQHALWPADRPPPAGWWPTGAVGDEAFCRSEVERSWVDIRPAAVVGHRPEGPLQPPDAVTGAAVAILRPGPQRVELVAPGPDALARLRRARSDGSVLLRFPDTDGGTEVAIRLASGADSGSPELAGDTELDGVRLHCVARLDLPAATGTALVTAPAGTAAPAVQPEAPLPDAAPGLGTADPPPGAQTVLDLLEAAARRWPDRVAVRAGGTALTYRGLRARVDRVAHALLRAGCAPGDLVGLLLPHGPDVVPLLLGMLRAAVVAVPLDPVNPPARTARLLSVTGVGRVIAGGPTPGEIGHPVDVLPARDLLERPADPRPVPALPVPPSGAAACVLFTSGSTGEPKAVALTHDNLARMVATQRAEGWVPPGGRVLEFASFGFDGSLWELFLAFGAGGTACLADRSGPFDAAKIAASIRQEAVAVAVLPPAAAALLDPAELAAVSTLLLAGERAAPDVVARLGEGRTLLNVYGTTETAAVSVVGPLGADQPVLGPALPGCTVAVLDDRLRPVPAGELGEIALGGNVALGYLGDPGLTAARFVPDAAGPPGARVYLTGDRGRLDGAGRLSFHGRTDHQVKVRGNRVELGEVEAVLGRHPQVGGAVALVHGDRPEQRSVVAFVVARGPAPDGNELREYCGRLLAPAAVPGRIELLEQLPLTANGKVDRDTLQGRLSAVPPGPAPAGAATEALIIQVWGEVLGVEAVDFEDDFFVLGGHSLSAVLVQGRLAELLGADLPVTLLFESSTVSALAAAVRRLLSVEADARARTALEWLAAPETASTPGGTTA